MIANHPNDLPDVLIGYVSTPRDVHYIATISAASNPLSRATYRGLGVIPVTRVRDARKLLEKGASIANVNRVAYRRVVQALMDGELIGVFPEGGVNTDWAMRSLKPGVAQMVLQCFDDDKCKPVTIVPLGIQYEEPDRPGSDCIARVGRPLIIDSAAVATGEWKVQNLTAALFERLAEVTRHGPDAAERAHVDRVAAVVGASLSNGPQDGLLIAGLVAPRLVAPGGSQSAVMDDADLRTDVQTICSVVERLGGRARSAGDHAILFAVAADATSIRGENVGSPPTAAGPARMTFPNSTSAWNWPAGVLRNGSAWLLAVTAPIAVVGWVIHAPLFAFIWRFAFRTAESRAHRAGRAHLPGIYIVLGWYLITAILAAFLFSWLGISPLYSLLLFMLLFRLGDVAVKWRHGVAALQFRMRAARLPDAQLRDLFDRYHRARTAWEREQPPTASIGTDLTGNVA